MPHEVRNPLTIVRGYLQVLYQKGKYPELGQYFELMISELDRANSIITEFLSLAKNKGVQLRRLNINRVLDDLQPLIQAEASLFGHETVFTTSDVPDLMLDDKEMRQLILNLVRNALEAMLSDGCVSVETYCEPDCVVLAVHDTGKGIPSDIIDKLGTPFFTTKPNGTGLGLPVCYRIAERHNAKMEITTSARGTTFLVRFCRSQFPPGGELK